VEQAVIQVKEREAKKAEIQLNKLMTERRRRAEWEAAEILATARQRADKIISEAKNAAKKS